MFGRHGLTGCAICPVAAEETLEEVALGRGLSLTELLHDLNDLLP